jgi:hypothetical protein
MNQLLPLKMMICRLLFLLIIGLILPLSAMECCDPASLDESGTRLIPHICQVLCREKGFKVVVMCRVSMAVQLVQPTELVKMQMLLKL